MGRVQGVVRVRATVDAGGVVQRADALDGPPLLKKSAEAVVWSYQFKPVLINGLAAPVVADLAIPFGSIEGQASLPERPVTGFVLHAENSSNNGDPKLEPGFMEKAAIAELEKMGLVARDPATADPSTTLALTLMLQTSRPNKKTISENLVARASLFADRGLIDNEPGKPDRVWVIKREIVCWPESEMEESFKRLLKPVMQTLMPTPEGVARQVVDFDFSKLVVRYTPPPPPYPPLAKIAKIQGAVIVEMTVDPAGIPISAMAVDGPLQLREWAEDSAYNWRYVPAMLNGLPTTMRFKLTLNFKLR